MPAWPKLDDLWSRIVFKVVRINSNELLQLLRCGSIAFWAFAAALFGILSTALFKKLGVLKTGFVFVALSCALQIWSTTPTYITGVPLGANTPSLSVMSFNLRGEGLDGGDLHWNSRRVGVVQMLKRELPAVVGTQEGSFEMLRYLEKNTHYELIDGRTDQLGRSVLFDPGQVQLVDMERFPLSVGPYAKGCSYSLFRILPNDKKGSHNPEVSAPSSKYLLHFNTHLDFVNETVRVQQALQLRAGIARHVAKLKESPNWHGGSEYTVVVTGDFNSLRYGRTWRTLTAAPVEEVVLDDSALTAASKVTPTYFSFNGYTGNSIESPFYAVPISVMCSIISIIPGMQNSLCVPMSLDFHVDWVLVGKVGFNASTTVHVDSHQSVLSDQSFFETLEPPASGPYHLSDHHPIKVRLSF